MKTRPSFLKFNLRLNLIFFITIIPMISSATLWVIGPSRTYKVPSAVESLVNNGDTIEIDNGLYQGDCALWSKNNLVLRGKGGMAHLDANGQSKQGKAIWVISGNNTTIEYIEFSGCTVVDKNGAGIRLEGTNFIVRHCYFHDNEDGILGGSSGDILIEYSEFSHNGYGDGYSHNIYINHANSLTLQYCYMHHTKIGHEVKSRAHKNYILYNRIMNESDGTASREIDLPDGGLAIVIGNLIQQGPNTSNSNMLGYGGESLSNNPPHQLYVINNTFVNQRGNNGVFISVPIATNLLKVYNNIFTGQPYTFLSGSATSIDTLTNLFIPDDTKAGFSNLAGYDYHLTSTSAAINKGSIPGNAGTFSLTPVFEYKHPMDNSNRTQLGQIDIGAYEFRTTSILKSDNTAQHVRFYNDRQTFTCYISLPDFSTATSIQVFDISGKNMVKPVKNIKNNFELNYNGWPKGLYLVKITMNGAEIIKKLLIN